MSINTSGNAWLHLPSLNLRVQLAQPADKSVVQRETAGQPQFMDVLIQSVKQTAGNATITDQGSSDSGIPPAKEIDADRALAIFVQDLFSALGRGEGNSAGTPTPTEGPGLTKEALASSLEEPKSSDSNRYDRNLALLNNFDTADTDGDGAISHAEAHAFNEANNIPTIESGTMVPPDQVPVST